MKKAKITSELKCFKILNSISNEFICENCKNETYYKNEINFCKVCKKCKKKHSVTKCKIFENVRFGLVKAFNIVYDIETSKEYISSIQISKKYEITQKTAWKFIQKINSNKHFVKRIFAEIEKKSNKKININSKKLEDFLNQQFSS